MKRPTVKATVLPERALSAVGKRIAWPVLVAFLTLSACAAPVQTRTVNDDGPATV